MPTQSTKALWLAYSGGLDSQVLLHLLHSGRQQLAPLQLRAVHIHHGLNPQADHWAAHCQHCCAELAIPCHVIRVQIPQNSGASLEALARTARYQAFTQLLQNDEAIVTAQHADDQAETLLLQLLRGAGAPGLAAMPAKTRLGTGWLLRPLLTVRRAELAAYAEAHDLKWVEDDSNQNLRFDRNFLRHNILPPLQQRWPHAVQSLCRAANYQAENAQLLSDLGKLDWQQASVATQLEQPQSTLQSVSIAALQKLNLARQNNLLRTWLAAQGYPPPPVSKLPQIHHSLLTASPDAQPCVAWQGVELRRFRGALYAMSPLPPVPPAFNAAWQNALPLPLGQLHLEQGGKLRWPLPNLSIRLRQGGETCRLHGKTQTLKKLLQASDLPTWLRAYLPLLYQGETLVAVPHITVCDGFRTEDGVKLRWTL